MLHVTKTKTFHYRTVNLSGGNLTAEDRNISSIVSITPIIYIFNILNYYIFDTVYNLESSESRSEIPGKFSKCSAGGLRKSVGLTESEM